MKYSHFRGGRQSEHIDEEALDDAHATSVAEYFDRKELNYPYDVKEEEGIDSFVFKTAEVESEPLVPGFHEHQTPSKRARGDTHVNSPPAEEPLHQSTGQFDDSGDSSVTAERVWSFCPNDMLASFRAQHAISSQQGEDPTSASSSSQRKKPRVTAEADTTAPLDIFADLASTASRVIKKEVHQRFTLCFFCDFLLPRHRAVLLRTSRECT